MAEATGLGIDSGGTGTRWCLATAETVIGEGRVAPVTGHVFTDDERERVALILGEIATAARRLAGPRGILAGITGLGPLSGVTEFYRDTLARLFGLAAANVTVVEDMWLGYRSFFDPGEGIIVYSGTGSIGFHLASNGQALRAGGRGILIDDGGSGAWIGQEALRAILRREDSTPGAGWATILGQLIGAVLPAPTWDAARVHVYGSGRSGLGALAPAVAEGAGMGDATAQAILSAAGAELARLAIALRTQAGDKPVVLTGRAAFIDPRIANAFAAAVPPPVRMEPSPPNAALVAARIAASPGPTA